MSRRSDSSKRYTAELKRDAVALALSSQKTVTEVARDPGVSPEGLRGWVKQAKVDRGEGPAGALTGAEREELVRSRRKVREAGGHDRGSGRSDRLPHSGQDGVDTAARCPLIDAERASEGNPAGHSVAFPCRVLGVPRSAHYAHKASRPARVVRERAEEVLVGEIRVLHAGSRGAYGAPPPRGGPGGW
ncbi:transposase [Streptomyces virginiae]|uniref:transposase n=1 Tax=Streptomyces virginiae TaxID=1961 RepID=UPI0036AC1D54